MTVVQQTPAEHAAAMAEARQQAAARMAVAAARLAAAGLPPPGRDEVIKALNRRVLAALIGGI